MANPPKKPFKKSNKKRTVNRSKAIVSAPVKSYVNKLLKNSVENKSIQYNGGFIMANYADDNQMRAFALSPGTTIPLNQGSGAGNRLGNRIKIVKATLNYWMVPAPYSGLLNPVPKPLMIRVWIGYSKTNPTLLPTAADMAVFFQNGSVANPPNNFIADMLRAVNKDKFVIFSDRKHKLGNADITGTGFTAGNQYYSNNDFKYNIMRKVDITNYIINNIKFDDSTVIPTTRGLFCWCQIVYADNTATTGQSPANFNYFVDLVFEDA